MEYLDIAGTVFAMAGGTSQLRGSTMAPAIHDRSAVRPNELRDYAERARRAAGCRFTAAQMVDQYQRLYHEICSTAGVA